MSLQFYYGSFIYVTTIYIFSLLVKISGFYNQNKEIILTASNLLTETAIPYQTEAQPMSYLLPEIIGSLQDNIKYMGTKKLHNRAPTYTIIEMSICLRVTTVNSCKHLKSCTIEG